MYAKRALGLIVVLASTAGLGQSQIVVDKQTNIDDNTKTTFSIASDSGHASDFAIRCEKHKMSLLFVTDVPIQEQEMFNYWTAIMAARVDDKKIKERQWGRLDDWRSASAFDKKLEKDVLEGKTLRVQWVTVTGNSLQASFNIAGFTDAVKASPDCPQF